MGQMRVSIKIIIIIDNIITKKKNYNLCQHNITYYNMITLSRESAAKKGAVSMKIL